MINIDFTEEEMQALKYERFHHPDPHVQRKMEALWLKSQKLSHKDICRLTGISPNTLRGYLRAYLKGGIEALKELNFYKPQSELCLHTKRSTLFSAVSTDHLVICILARSKRSISDFISAGSSCSLGSARSLASFGCFTMSITMILTIAITKTVPIISAFYFLRMFFISFTLYTQ